MSLNIFFHPWFIGKQWFRKRPITNFKHGVRRLLGGKRSHPSFIIVGQQKCGTTSLFNYLIQHEHIKAPLVKEIHFFNEFEKKGKERYHVFFPFLEDINDITGESTPDYLSHPGAAQKMFVYNKELKLIVLLRDPVKRAFSHYQMEKRKGHEKRSFKIAISDELKNFDEQFIEDVSKKKENYFHYYYHSYLTRGKYSSFIKEYTDLFGKEKILILDSRDLKRETQAVLDTVFDFLGVERKVIEDLGSYNSGGSYEKIDLDIEKELYEFYKPYNEELYKLTGINFNRKINS